MKELSTARNVRIARGSGRLSVPCLIAIAIICSFASSARAQYSEVNNAGPFNWNAAPWGSGEPTGANNLIGLTRGGGTMTIDTPEVAGGLLVGWQGNYTVIMNAGGSLTLGGGSVPGDSLLFLSENGAGQGTFTQNGGTVSTAGVRFNRNGGANNGTYNLNGGTLSTSFLFSHQNTANFNFNGGTLRATASDPNWFGANINANVQAGGAVIDSQAFNVTVNSSLFGAGGLTKQGTGTLILAATPSYGGTTIVSGGTLQIGTGQALTALPLGDVQIAAGASIVYHRNSATTDFTTQGFSGAGDIIFRGQSTGYFRFNASYTDVMAHTGRTIVDYDAAVGGTQWFHRTLWLEKDNVHSSCASFDLLSGKVYLRNSTTLGQTFKGINGVAGTFITTEQGVNQGVNSDVAAAQTFTFHGVIGADGTGVGNNNLSFTKLGAGTQVFTGDNTYGGGTTINGGILQIGNGGATGALGSGNIVINAGGNLTINRNNTYTIGSAISGAGSFTQAGTGTTIITGNPTYIGLMTISAGALQIGNNNPGNLGGSSFAISGGTDLIFHCNGDNTEFISQSISGAGDLVFRGQLNGYYTFRNAYTGTMSHSGSTVVNLDDNAGNTWYQGTLWLEKDNVHSPNASVALESGKIYMRNSNVAGQTFAGLSGNAGTFITTDLGVLQRLNLNTPGSQLFDYAGAIGADGTGVGTNNVSVTKLGAGTQVFSGTNTYAGSTNVAAGILAVDGAHTGAGSYTVQNGATLGGDGAISFGAGNSMTVAGNGGRLSPGNTTDAGYAGADRTYSAGADSRTVGMLTLNANSAGDQALNMNGILQLDFLSPLEHDLLHVAAGTVNINDDPVSGAVLEINGQQNLSNIDFGLLGLTNGTRVDLLLAMEINGSFRNFAPNTTITDVGGNSVLLGADGSSLFLQIVPEPNSVFSWVLTAGGLTLVFAHRRWRRQ